MYRNIALIVFLTAIRFMVGAATVVTIDNPEDWAYTDLKPYIGQTIQFANPMYVTNNYNSSSLEISPRI